jgi:hypothetical protein
VAFLKLLSQSDSFRTMEIQGGTNMLAKGKERVGRTDYERHQSEQTLRERASPQSQVPRLFSRRPVALDNPLILLYFGPGRRRLRRDHRRAGIPDFPRGGKLCPAVAHRRPVRADWPGDTPYARNSSAANTRRAITGFSDGAAKTDDADWVPGLAFGVYSTILQFAVNPALTKRSEQDEDS